MKTKEIQTTLRKTGLMLKKNSPTILTGLAVGGLFATVALAIKATPRAIQILENAESKVEKPIKPMETIKLTWKCYIPTGLMGLATTGCIIGANSINLRRSAALASAYSITEAALKEYQAKVVETIGETKARKIKDEIAAERLKKDPVTNKEVIITGKGDMLCYDKISGRYFKNNIEQLRRVQNDLNHNLISEMFISLNEFYYAIGLPGIKIGEELGWNVDRLIELSFSSMLSEEGEPCLVIDYCIGPRESFRELF